MGLVEDSWNTEIEVRNVLLIIGEERWRTREFWEDTSNSFSVLELQPGAWLLGPLADKRAVADISRSIFGEDGFGGRHVEH